MRHFLLASVIAASFVSAPAFAQQMFGPEMVTSSQIQDMRKGDLMRVRREALIQRAADGGRLSEQSRARLQRDVDRVEADYIRRLEKYSPFVNKYSNGKLRSW